VDRTSATGIIAGGALSRAGPAIAGVSQKSAKKSQLGIAFRLMRIYVRHCRKCGESDDKELSPMSDVKVNYSELSNLTSKHTVAASQIDQLERSLFALLNGTEWTGQAKVDAQQTWQSTFAPAFQALRQANVVHGQNIQKVSGGFNEMDQAAARKLRA